MPSLSKKKWDQIVDLAQCATDVLFAARLVFWEYDMKEHEQDDPSFQNALDELARALAGMGLPTQKTQEDFEAHLEQVLKMSPEAFLTRLDRVKECKKDWFRGVQERPII